MTRPTTARFGALALSTLLLAAACGDAAPPSASPSATIIPPTPTAAPSASTVPSAAPSSAATDTDAIYDAIEAQVDELRGLTPVDVQRQTIDEAALGEKSTADFDEDNPPEYVEANERLYQALGLLEKDDSLRDLYLALIESQVAGFYRPDEKTLYVVSRSGTVNGADKITFAHEYDHALQDANFDVFKDPEALRDQTDEALARAALYEGDATLLMSQWAIPNMTPEELQDVVAAGNDPKANEVLAATPPILTESLLFPYNAGLAFIQPKQLGGGWAGVDEVYSRLPASTEQILHPEKYDAQEAPVAVTLPTQLAEGMGAGWSVALEDTWGEFQTGIWLRESGVPAADATAAAAGWGGDRLAVLSGPDGAWGVAMQFAWDSGVDADAFETAAGTAIKAAGGPAQVVPADETTRWVLVASDDETLNSLATAAGLAG
jgi:hypothetical protein